MKVDVCGALRRGVLFTAALLLPFAAQAQRAQQITQPIDATQRQTLGGVPALAATAGDRGPVDPGLPMKDMLLMLHPAAAQSAALKQYVEDLHNPHSPSFHKWLTPAQYAAQFGVADADVKIVNGWLSSNGFAVQQVARGRNWIRFSGSASQVETAFQTEIHTYSVNGATKYANATSLSIPAALAPAVSGVVSMNNFLSSPQHTNADKITRNQNGKLVRVVSTSLPTKNGTTGGTSPAFTTSPDQTATYIAPGDFSKIYDAQSVVASGTDGTGVSIAVVGRSDISLSDVEAFRTISGLPANDPTVIYPGDDPGVVSGDDLEGSLDVEWAGAIAPKAKINFVIGDSTLTTDGADLAASYIVDNVTSPIMTVSFGLCEALMSDTQINFYHLLWQQAAAEGITVFVAAGDAGSSGCNTPTNYQTVYGFGVNGLASTPYNVAVGGTEFNDADVSTYWNVNNANDQSSAKGYIPEAVWNESCSPNVTPSSTNCAFPPYYLYTYAGGGGASSCLTRTNDGEGDEYCAAGYPKPSWQAGNGVPNDGVRDLPDVALAAASEHDAYLFCYDGGCQWTTNADGSITLQDANIVGGTSAASPSMASIMALVEQKQGTPQGVANYELYALAQAQESGSCDSSSRTDPTQPGTCVFNDITAGSNAVSCTAGGQDCQGQDSPVEVGATLPAPIFYGNSVMDGYSAAAGYDLGSGLGSVDVANLVSHWGAPTAGSATTTTLSLSQTTFTHGTPVTVSGTVTGASSASAPTGEVLVQAGSTGVQDVALASGAFSGSIGSLPGGTYNVTAQYSGDVSNAPSTSAPVSVTVAPEAATVVGNSFAYSLLRLFGGEVLLNTSQTTLGSQFWLQFQVVGASGSTNATGSIKLSQGSKVIGTFPVDQSGEIYIQCGPLTSCDYPAGTYTFTASYAGDSSYKAASTTLTFTLTQGTPRTSVSVDNATPPTNGLVNAEIQWNVDDPGYPPTGTISLVRLDTGAVLGTATLNKTGITYIPFHAPTGDYFISASYAGDANYGPNNPTTGITQEIITSDLGGTKAVSVTISLGGSSFSMGQRTPATITVQSSKSGVTGTPIGSVTLYSSISQTNALTGQNSGAITGQWSLVGGKAAGTVQWSLVGTQGIYAVYGGDGNFAGGTSTPVTVTVAQAVPTVTVQPLATVVAVGGQASVTALLSSALSSASVPAPTGTIQFYDSVNNGAAQAIGNPQALNSGNGGTILATLAPVLAAGQHSITAKYSGDANWLSATSAAVSISATTPDFAATATPTALTLTAGDSAALSIATQSILGYDTPVAISCGGTLPPGVSCTSATVNPGASGTITIASTAPGTATAASAAAKTGATLWKISGTAAFAALFLFCIPNRRRFTHLAILLAAVAVTFGVAGCGGSGGMSPLPTSVSLTSSSTKVASGASVIFQASITSASNTTTGGTVTFYDGTTALGSPVTPTNGIATLSITSLSVGTHAITAKYSGDKSNEASSSSDVLNQTITGQFTLTVNATSGALTHPISIPATLQ